MIPQYELSSQWLVHNYYTRIYKNQRNLRTIKWGEFVKFWVLSEATKQPRLLLLQLKLDYIPDIFPQTGCSAKTLV